MSLLGSRCLKKLIYISIYLLGGQNHKGVLLSVEYTLFFICVYFSFLFNFCFQLFSFSFSFKSGFARLSLDFILFKNVLV